MATHESGERSATRNVAATAGRFTLVTVMALVEAVALGVWLRLVRTAPVASLTTAVGFAVLAGGLVVTFTVADVAVNGSAASFPGPRAIAVVLIETGLWALWLLVIDRIGGLPGIAVAGAALAALLVPQHTLADNVLRGKAAVSTLVDFDALGFSLVQAGGATLWYLFATRGELLRPLLADADALVGSHLPVDVAALDPALAGLAALAAALFVEHLVGVSFSRHGERSSADPSLQRR